MRFTAADKLACAERELRLRERVYPRQVEQGRMTRAQAGHETAVMREIVEDYRAQASGERLL